MYPKSLESLIENLMTLPGVGRKTAERYALTLLEKSDDTMDRIARSLLEVKSNLTTCEVCHNYSEQPLCDICLDKTRDGSKICVIASAKEIYSIEKTGLYRGKYHVLGGLISTRKGIMPEDLTFNDFEKRLNESVKEVILALNATVEGETTALFISKKYENKTNITRLAFGLPMGGQLDYADDMTLLKAFEGRKKM